MGKYFDCYGSYRLTHAVSDLHRNHPEWRNGIDSVIKGKQSQYTATAKIVDSHVRYRFYANDEKDHVDVEIVETGESRGGHDVEKLQRALGEVEHIVADLLRNPNPKMVAYVVRVFNGSHGWTITEDEAKLCLMDIAEHVRR